MGIGRLIQRFATHGAEKLGGFVGAPPTPHVPAQPHGLSSTGFHPMSRPPRYGHVPSAPPGGQPMPMAAPAWQAPPNAAPHFQGAMPPNRPPPAWQAPQGHMPPAAPPMPPRPQAMYPAYPPGPPPMPPRPQGYLPQSYQQQLDQLRPHQPQPHPPQTFQPQTFQPQPMPGRPMGLPMPAQASPMRPQHWQQPAPQGLPMQAPGGYPIQVRPPANGPALFHPQQVQATNVPHASMPQNVQRLYQDMNLKVTHDTQPAFTNQNLMAASDRPMSGKFNATYSVTLSKPGGGTMDGVFKPLGKEEKTWVATATGIPRNDPQIAMRNLATQAYGQKLLGIDVVPETKVAVMSVGPNARSEGPRLGLVMAKAAGKSASQMSMSELDRPDVRAQMTQLQLLDHLTGQGDRHSGNIFVDVQGGRAKVTGIDNDLCFGQKLTDPNGIHLDRSDPIQRGFRGTKMPPVVDSDMARRINALTPDHIRQQLGDKLSPAEVEAAVSRHAGVKQHVANLQQQGMVIDPSQWGHPTVNQLMTPDNSYHAREVNDAFSRQRAAVQRW